MNRIEFQLERIALLDVAARYRTQFENHGAVAECLWHEDDVTGFEFHLGLADLASHVAANFIRARHSVEDKNGYVPF